MVGGEIVGVAGVAGAAQPALSSILAGTRRPTAGRVFLDGADITGSAGYAVRLGLAYIPDERAAGIVPALSVATNASLLRLFGASRFAAPGCGARARGNALRS